MHVLSPVRRVAVIGTVAVGIAVSACGIGSAATVVAPRHAATATAAQPDKPDSTSEEIMK